MKNKVLSTITCLITSGLLVAVSSCSEEKYLDTVPPTQISAANVFDTPARILGLVNGIYKAQKSSSYLGGRFQFYLDVSGEDFINTTANSFTGYESWNHSYTSGSNDVINAWSAAYTTINLSNILIDGLQKNTNVITAELSTQYTAEAKFLRAYSYFNLVTIFAQPYAKDNGASPGLPLRLVAETNTENNDLKRSSVAEIYTQIIKDLDEAEAGLPASYSTEELNVTRAHKNAAIALKTRVYLNMANYAKVVEEAKKIVPQTTAPFASTINIKHALQANIVTTLMSSFTTVESILSVPFSSQDMYSGQSAIGYIYNGNSEYYMNPSGIFGSAQFASTDARRGFFRTNATLGRSYLSKFGQNAPYLIYMPLIRYSEILLNYAEAAAETGDLTLSAALLKAVHARSDASYTFSELTTKDALITAILAERRIELLGEGFRSNDLHRRLLTIPAKAGPAFNATAVEPSAANYIWPISNSEIVTNRAIFD
ncbi:MAG: RagB/SusD family nutrient uptake outer membrane protein [Siphonobacter sp.]